MRGKMFLTWLGCVNYIVQFLFIRIYKSVDNGVIKGYGILYFVLPLSGWFNPYVVIGGGKIKLTKLIWRTSK